VVFGNHSATTHHQFERWGQLRSDGQGHRTINLYTPMMADDPDDLEESPAEELGGLR